MKLHAIWLMTIALCLGSINIFADHDGYAPVKDAKLYYQVIGKGQPVIFLHGGPGLGFSYLLPQLGHIGETSQAIFYDQRSSGKSTPFTLVPEQMNLELFLQDLEQLRTHLRHEKVVLVGHSWGGMLAMAYAIKYPQHVKALILMDSMPATSQGYDALDKSFNQRLQLVDAQIDALMHSRDFIQGNQEVYVKYFNLVSAQFLYDPLSIKKISTNFSLETATNQVNTDALFTKHVFSKPYDLRPQLSQLRIPTLIIHGDTDPIPVWTARQIAESIPGSRFVIIKKSGHFSYAEQEADVLSEIKHFLLSLDTAAFMAQEDTQALNDFHQLKQQLINETDPLIIAWYDKLLVLHNKKTTEYPIINATFNDLKSISHICVLGIYGLFSANMDNKTFMDQVKTHKKLVMQTSQRVDELSLTSEQKTRQKKLLILTQQFLENTLSTGKPSPTAVEHFLITIRPLAMQNVIDAVIELIDTLNKQMIAIQQLLTAKERAELFVVVPVQKMAHSNNILGQYFEKYLNEKIDMNHLIYAENAKDINEALNILGDWKVQRNLSMAFFQNKTRLDFDLFGTEAQKILQHCAVDKTGKQALICEKSATE